MQRPQSIVQPYAMSWLTEAQTLPESANAIRERRGGEGGDRTLFIRERDEGEVGRGADNCVIGSLIVRFVGPRRGADFARSRLTAVRKRLIRWTFGEWRDGVLTKCT